MAVHLDSDRLASTMKKQAEFGQTPEGGLQRVALSDADMKVRDWFVSELQDLNLNVRVDRMGNIFARRHGTDPSASPVLAGSHLDSQPNGGIYDGALGVVAVLELFRTLDEKDIQTEHPIEIVNWTNEEGTRFQPGLQGSGVWTGQFDLEHQYTREDDHGICFEKELNRIGYKGDEPATPIEEYDAYYELHIEQGPYLEQEKKDVGIVNGVVARSWGKVTFQGDANHAGSTPMHLRVDAGVPAAEFALCVRRLSNTLGEKTVSTVGSISVQPDSINIIPSTATVTWDIRDPSDAVIERAVSHLRSKARAISQREGAEYTLKETTRTDGVTFESCCTNKIKKAATTLGYDSLHLLSGGNHDASHLSDVCDVGMVFAVSEDGKSHSPKEYTSWNDCYRAANTLANAVIATAGR